MLTFNDKSKEVMANLGFGSMEPDDCDCICWAADWGMPDPGPGAAIIITAMWRKVKVHVVKFSPQSPNEADRVTYIQESSIEDTLTPLVDSLTAELGDARPSEPLAVILNRRRSRRAAAGGE